MSLKSRIGHLSTYKITKKKRIRLWCGQWKKRKLTERLICVFGKSRCTVTSLTALIFMKKLWLEQDMAEGYQQMPDDGESETSEEGSSSDERIIHINGQQEVSFCSNKISTSKYNVFTFLPKFLFSQFRHYHNIYFLIISLIQQYPKVSGVGKYTTIVPLGLILAISAVKEIIEDYKRNKADKKVNNKTVLVIRNDQWQEIRWRDVKVGDIVKVVDGQNFPADLILLSSSEPQAMCYVETANLDGETNLKIKQGLPQTAELLRREDLVGLSGRVTCEPPNKHLQEFVGIIQLTSKETAPLGPSQLLLRGAALRNTHWIFGVVAYTGRESKVMLNSTKARPKMSNVERTTNIQILFLFSVVLVLGLSCTIAKRVWLTKNKIDHWYLGYLALQPDGFGFDFISFILLFNTLIPISLPVTLEMVKFMQGFFINWDLDMYCEETDTPAVARTSRLNEELGQIKYLFSDKTGTLTRNVMNFRKCSVAGVCYGNNEESEGTFNDSAIIDNLKRGHATSPEIREFLTILAVCHTVIPQKDGDGSISYQASSPDEAALVKGAKQLGFVFSSRTPEAVTIDVFGEEECYEILHVLEFTSERKRMSVIVKTTDGKIKLYLKGADSVVYERLNINQHFSEITLQHLEEFATLGLRTLCIATCEVNEEFYKQWRKIHHRASTALQNREKKLEEAAELIEKDLILIGATAIEDKLQAEVPETISRLMAANIKIWMLTGDKQETAINIGYSCKLLTSDMQLLVINGENLDGTRDVLRRHIEDLEEMTEANIGVALIINGKSLKYALSCDCKKDFLNIAIHCRAVICCRASPSQKAELVNLVKKECKAITLAIGDGANDVGMIQAAHVGVGISGMEGLHAAAASDYSIAQFRFLNKLLLVHGAWNYIRLCKLILYAFYKNTCLYFIEFWFAIVNAFSGQILFEEWTLGFYNVFFTAAPPLAMGLLDRCCSAENRIRFPELYEDSQNAHLFNVKVFLQWILNAVYQSILLFLMPLLALCQDVEYSGKVAGYLFLGNIVYTYTVVTVCLKAGLEIYSWTWLTHVSIWGSIIFWFLFFIGYSYFYSIFHLVPEMNAMANHVLGCPSFWIGLLLIPFTCLMTDITWKAFHRTVFKSLREKVREAEVCHKDPSSMVTMSRERLTESTHLLSYAFSNPQSRQVSTDTQRGFAFSQEEHGTVNQADLIRSYNSIREKPEGR